MKTQKKHYRILFLWLFIFCFFTKNLKAQCTGVSVSDSLALVDFYNATDGDNWNNNNGWLEGPVSTWERITLSDDGCLVVYINSSNNNISGTLIDLNLPNLEYLSLRQNELVGSIPNFTNLPKLKHLDLGCNELTGSIPNFTNLPLLEELGLINNKLTGSIPNFSNLPNVKILELGSNELTGSIPTFANFPNLVSLFLYRNQLTGSIPNFTNLPNLTGLGLHKNNLTGIIPNFDNLFNLKYLHLYDNELVGNIPNFDTSDLHTLYLSNNKLTGNIPNFNLPELEYLTICDNNLFGNIPNFENCPNLIIEFIDFSCVDVSGNSIFETENSLVTLYPNPATTAFYLNFSEIKQNIETAKLEIYDVFGRLVLAQKVNRNLNKINIESIENGVYVYKIVGENAVLGSGKIMVQ